MTIQARHMKVPELVLVGSSGRNSGKTTAALALIESLRGAAPIAALKVTTAGEASEACHRGGDGCGACSFGPGYVLEQELDSASGKDTSRLLAAGADVSYWLRARDASLADGFARFHSLVKPGTLIVAESNSLRRVIEPGLFIMLANLDEPARPGAKRVVNLADLIVKSHGPVLPGAAKILASRVFATRELSGLFRLSLTPAVDSSASDDSSAPGLRPGDHLA